MHSCYFVYTCFICLIKEHGVSQKMCCYGDYWLEPKETVVTSLQLVWIYSESNSNRRNFWSSRYFTEDSLTFVRSVFVPVSIAMVNSKLPWIKYFLSCQHICDFLDSTVYRRKKFIFCQNFCNYKSHRR